MGDLIDNDTKKIILGAALITGGVLLFPISGPGGVLLIQAGVGLILMAAASGEDISSADLIAGVQNLTISNRSTTQPWNIIYGRARVGGTFVFGHLTGTDLEFLNLVVVLAGHQIEDIGEGLLNGGSNFPEYIYLDGKRVSMDPDTGDVLRNQPKTGGGTKVHSPFVYSVPFTGVDIVNDAILIQDDGINVADAHYLTQNQRVRYSANATPIGGLVEGEVYFIDTTFSASTIRLMLRFDSGEPIFIDLTSQGTGAHSFTLEEFAQTVSYVDEDDLNPAIHVETRRGDETQLALGNLVTEINDANLWGANHRLRGRAYAWIRLRWDPEMFAGGIPAISFDLRGKKLWDPRIGSDPDLNVIGGIRSHNPALIALDYLVNGATTAQRDTGAYGLGVAVADLDQGVGGSIQAAADLCDEDVDLRFGGTEKRYTAHGAMSVQKTPKANLKNILSSMRGKITYVGGKWKIYAAGFITPFSTSFDEDSFLSTPAVQSLVSRRENFNAVKGVFISPWTDFLVGEYPQVLDATAQSEDGGVRVYSEVNLPMVISPSQAQRLAKIHLQSIRQNITVSLLGNLSLFQIEPVETLQLTIPNLSWTDKIFEVVSGSLTLGNSGQLGYSVNLRETASTVYNWDEATEEDIGIDKRYGAFFKTSILRVGTQSPDSNVSSIVLTSGTAELFLRLDGTVHSRLKASWTLPNNIFILQGGRIEIQFKKTADSIWRDAGTVPGNAVEHFILDVEDGQEYEVRIRTVNSIGFRGQFVVTSGHTVVGKTDPPANVTGFAAVLVRGGFQLSWNEIADIDKDQYIIKTGTVWASGVQIVKTKALGFLLTTPVSETNNLMIKAVDTTGNESTTEASIAPSLAVPTTVTGFAGVIERGGIRLTWDASSDLNHLEYEVRSGTIWASGIVIARRAATEFFHETVVLGNNNFMIRGIDTFGFESVEASITINYIRPADVGSFLAAQNGGIVILAWADVVFANLHGYTVKYIKQSATPIWENGIVVTENDRTTSHTTSAIPPGSWTVMVKAIDLFSFESLNAVTSDITVTQIHAEVFREDHGSTVVAIPSSSDLEPWEHDVSIVVTNFIDNHYTGRMPIADQTDADDAKSVSQVSTVECVGNGSGDPLSGTYFLLNPNDDWTSYYVWYDVDGGSSDPAPSGVFVGIEVDISAGDSAAEVATATAAAIDAIPTFSAEVASGPTDVVTITNAGAGPATALSDGNTGHTAFIVVTTGFDVLSIYVDNPFNTSTFETQEYVLALATSVRVFAEIDMSLHPDEIIGAVAASLEVNLDPDGLGFTGWNAFISGLVIVKKVKFRLTSDNTKGEGVATRFEVVIDQPPRSERAKDVIVSDTGTAVVFAEQFLETPVVKLAVEQPSGNTVFVGYRNKTTSGFNIFVFDDAGVAVDGALVDWEASNI